MSKLRLVTFPDGRVRWMPVEEVRRRLASSKGGRTAARRGTRYTWTSKTARKAALKAWATRWRRLHYSGVRAGRPRRQRPAVDHAKLRAYYAKHPTLGIRYDPYLEQWIQNLTVDGAERDAISERTALIRLGHLPPHRPRLVPIDNGIEIASRRRR